MSELTSNQQRMVEEVLDDFNWDVVYKHMHDTNWAYRTDEGYSVPTFSEIRGMAKGLLERVLTNETEWYISSGGFHAFLKDGGLSLLFVLEESATLDDTYADEGRYDKAPNIVHELAETRREYEGDKIDAEEFRW